MQPQDIPPASSTRRDSSSPFLRNVGDTSAFFVGSPQAIDNSQAHYPLDPDHDAALPSTPILHSITTQPTTPNSFHRRRAQIASDGTPGSQRSGQNPRLPEQQWTLFGQLMENEGFLPTSPGARSNRSRSTSFVSDYFYQDSSSAPSSSLRGDPRPANRQPSPLRDSTTTHRLAALRDYDSDDSASIASTVQPQSPPKETWLTRLSKKLTLSLVYRNILKCAIAYLLASLFTFSPFFSNIITDMDASGPSSSGHMVATIAVYFNPAKTVGGMIEADLFCLFGLLYASVVCLISMSMFWFLEVRPGWEWMADIVAVVWIGLSMSILAWMKVWMGNPSFNTACSMTAIIIFIVIIKEGGFESLLQVSGIVALGSFISNLVCYLLWPQTAITNLRNSMDKTLDSFTTLLPMLTKIFLLENDSESHMIDLAKIQTAVDNHQNSFTSLQKNLAEAKTEWVLTGGLGGDIDELENIPGYSEISGKHSYEDAVDSLNRLAQHLNGLRSGTRLQYDLAKAGIKRQRPQSTSGRAARTEEQAKVEEGQAFLQAAADMFGDLVEELGPPLKALSTVSTQTIKKLQNACLQAQKKHQNITDATQPHEFAEIVEGIEAALVRFESTSNHAVLRLYRRSDINPLSQSLSSSSTSTGRGSEGNEVTESDNESVFLVYFFIFTLQEFAKELISLVDSVERIYFFEQRKLLQPSWWRRCMSSVVGVFSSVFSKKRVPERRRTVNIRKSLLYMIPPHRRTHPAFPKIRPHAPDTIQTPHRSSLSFWGKVNQTIWTIGKRLREGDTKYAIKAGLAMAVLAAPAFIDSTRPMFLEYYGDWALISLFVVISPTIGATNYLSFQRLLGTLFGAAVAVALYSSFPENAVVLATFGFLFSLPCFYFAVAKPKYLSASRFVLLTYNLTCLYCYNRREHDTSVVDIGFHRAVAVTAGILWAAFVSRFWWPAEARKELSRSLSEFCLNIGWLYTRLVASNSFAPEYQGGVSNPQSDPPSRTATTRLSNSVHEFMAMELHLQIKLIELQSLLAQAQHEPRLKGPFPVDLYRQILISLQTILDKLHSMRCVTTREECVRQDFIVPVNKERREMVGNIMLSFSTLAASFRLKAPLPPYLPPVEKSRLRLVEAIRKLDVVKNRDVKVSRQLLFFAYALTMKGVTMELEFLGRTLQDAFGVIGQTAAEFEMLFLPLDEARAQVEHVS